MGITEVAVEISNPRDQTRWQTVSLDGDTGAIFSVIPKAILEQLGINKQSHFAAGVLTPALTKGDVQPPLETPFNGSTLKSAWSTMNISSTP